MINISIYYVTTKVQQNSNISQQNFKKQPNTINHNPQPINKSINKSNNNSIPSNNKLIQQNRQPKIITNQKSNTIDEKLIDLCALIHDMDEKLQHITTIISKNNTLSKINPQNNNLGDLILSNHQNLDMSMKQISSQIQKIENKILPSDNLSQEPMPIVLEKLHHRIAMLEKRLENIIQPTSNIKNPELLNAQDNQNQSINNNNKILLALEDKMNKLEKMMQENHTKLNERMYKIEEQVKSDQLRLNVLTEQMKDMGPGVGDNYKSRIKILEDFMVKLRSDYNKFNNVNIMMKELKILLSLLKKHNVRSFNFSTHLTDQTALNNIRKPSLNH